MALPPANIKSHKKRFFITIIIVYLHRKYNH